MDIHGAWTGHGYTDIHSYFLNGHGYCVLKAGRLARLMLMFHWLEKELCNCQHA